MKYSITLKFLAVTLCALSLVTLAFGGIGIAFMEGYDLYNVSLESKRAEQMDMVGSTIALQHARMHAANNLSNVPQELITQMGYAYDYPYNYGGYLVDIYEDGVLSATEIMAYDGDINREDCYLYRETVVADYPVVTNQYYMDEYGSILQKSALGIAEDSIATASGLTSGEILAMVADQKAVYSEEYHEPYQYHEGLGISYRGVYILNYYQSPEYEIHVYLTPDAMIGADYKLLTVLHPYRDYLIPMALVSLLVFAVSFVFLCAVAGRSRNGEVKLAAINRIPLDLHALCMAGMTAALFLPLLWLYESAYWNNTADIWDNPLLCLLICCVCGFGMALSVIGFLYAFAAQIKASNNYWLRHTVIGWFFRQCGKFFRMVGRGLGLLGKSCRAVFDLLPVIWQWILTAGAMSLGVLIAALLTFRSSYVRCNEFFLMVLLTVILVCAGVVLYGGWCFGTLLKGVKHMAQGNLDYQIPTKHLFGAFRDFAVWLNSLADAAQIAAQRQMKSERMKTELITNVSHDIKTPLTSIINYVDLMKKPHSDMEGVQYLEVLDRQSQRLKKLVDDLMEMSKANSGTMSVELTDLDAAEAVNQALGEFSDKLARVGLMPVFRHPEEPVIMRADGRLLWRVLSNILNNAVKYAMPDTRLYVDLMVLQGNAVIAVKNISREQLNVSADELMERFVRGDSSRNTEGSGLGLNIAKSLVELQRGQMHLMVDGDLFKVTLIFPCKESS